METMAMPEAPLLQARPTRAALEAELAATREKLAALEKALAEHGGDEPVVPAAADAAGAPLLRRKRRPRAAPPQIPAAPPAAAQADQQNINELLAHLHLQLERLQAAWASVNLAEVKRLAEWVKAQAVANHYPLLETPAGALAAAVQREDMASVAASIDSLVQSAATLAATGVK